MIENVKGNRAEGRIREDLSTFEKWDKIFVPREYGVVAKTKPCKNILLLSNHQNMEGKIHSRHSMKVGLHEKANAGDSINTVNHVLRTQLIDFSDADEIIEV